jgi:urea transport system substrate-binding protein
MLVGGRHCWRCWSLPLVSLRILQPGPDRSVVVPRRRWWPIWRWWWRHLPPIKVGVVNSPSGTMAISSRPIVEATLLAFEEINAAGVCWADASSRFRATASRLNELFARDRAAYQGREKVVTIFGGWTSNRRRAMKEIAQHDHLLISRPVTRALRTSPNIIYNGRSASRSSWRCTGPGQAG